MTHRRWGRVGGLLLLAGLLGTHSSPAGATVADDVCGPLDDPCVISGALTATASSTLDFGARTLSIGGSGVLTWSEDLAITAGTCAFEVGSKVVEGKTSSGTGFLELTCGATTLAGTISTVGAGVLVEGDGPHVLSGKLSAKGDQVGVIAIDSYGVPGDITISGQIAAQSKLGTPPGEFRLLSNFGDIAITEMAKIKLKGATADPFSEFFIVEAGSGSLTVDGKIDARAKLGAYGFNFEADQDTTFGPKSQVKAKAKESGAEIAINSQSGSVTLLGKMLAKVSGATSGARVHVCAADDIIADKAKIDVSDKASDSSIIFGAGDRVSFDNNAKLTAKNEGTIEICGNTTGVTGISDVTITPEPFAVGMNECLSPTSQLIFFLDCNQ